MKANHITEPASYPFVANGAMGCLVMLSLALQITRCG